MKIGFTGARSLRHRFLAVSVIVLGGMGATAVYNSEEHKLIADRGVSRVNQRSAQLPHPTRFRNVGVDWALYHYHYAKLLAVGTHHAKVDGDEEKSLREIKGTQDNSYWHGYGQREYNLKIDVPLGSYLELRELTVSGWTNAENEFSFGELVSLYGDYRRTVHCVAGRCYLTNSDSPQYRNPAGGTSNALPGTVYFEYGQNCFPNENPFNCGWEPEKRPMALYLRSIGSGLLPPMGGKGNFFAETAWPEEELDAAWWGDEMMRIAMVNDWHWSSAGIAWYIGMHRLALLYVQAARTDNRYWNQALHYEANALHSLTDLFAYGHVVTNRDRTSHRVMEDATLLDRTAYRWMENALRMGGANRVSDGQVYLSAVLPTPIADLPTERHDFLPSNIRNWAQVALDEHLLHNKFNEGGASVWNLKRQHFWIYGDGELERSGDLGARGGTADIIAEAVRASVQSLFDAYERTGATIEEIGSPGSPYFDALLSVPIFVESDRDHVFDGRWTFYAAMVDAVTQAGIVPGAAALRCTMQYVDGRIAPPSGGQAACMAFAPPPAGALVVEELVSSNGVLGRGDRAHLDAEGNKNNDYDVGDFLAWVRRTGATPGNLPSVHVVVPQGGNR